MSAVCPDYMSALVGFRAWNLNNEGDLVSLNDCVPWPGKTKAIAVCTKLREPQWGASQMVRSGMAYLTSSMYGTTSIFSMPVAQPQVMASNFADWWSRNVKRRDYERTMRDHHSPMPNCTCGFYAAKSDQSDHFNSYAAGKPVWGEVYLWGKLQEYSEGYRAEFAYPKSLSTTNERMVNRLIERYDVPCVLVKRATYDPATDRTFAPWMSVLGGIGAGSTSANYGNMSSSAFTQINGPSGSTSGYQAPVSKSTWQRFFGVVSGAS